MKKTPIILIIAGIVVTIMVSIGFYRVALEVKKINDNVSRIIEEEDMNALQQVIGITNSTWATSHDSMIRQNLIASFASTTYLRINYASTTYLQIASTSPYNITTLSNLVSVGALTTASGNISLWTNNLGYITNQNWNFATPNAIKPTSTTGIIVNASSTFSGPVDFRTGTTTSMFIYPRFRIATTTAWSGTTTIALGVNFVPETWTGVKCFTNTGTLSLRFGDGTNKMDWVPVSTTVGEIVLSTNNTFTVNEKTYVEIGSPTSSPQEISCSVKKYFTP
jgi:hypothetical protein